MKFDYSMDPKVIKLSKELEETWNENLQNSANVFENILKSILPQGLPSVKSRSITRILHKMDLAVSNKETEIELDPSEYNTLKEIFLNEGVIVPPDFFRPFDYYYNKLSSFV